jgi:cell division protein FtsB
VKEKKQTISTLFFLVVGCLAILTTFYFVAEWKKKETNIQKMVAELNKEREVVEKKNNVLKEKISYLSTEDSSERLAKENLNYQKDDEKVVIIRRPIEEVKAESGEEKKVNVNEEKKPHFKVWWKYFFGKVED